MSSFYMYKLGRDYKIEQINLDLQSGILKSQLALLEDQVGDTVRDISNLDSEIEALNKSRLPKDDYNSYIEKFNQLVSKRDLAIEKNVPLRNRLQDHKEKSIKLEHEMSLALINSEEKALFERAIYIGIFISIVLIFLGFFLWYIKLQIYQDMILKNQANATNNEINSQSLLASVYDKEQNEKDLPGQRPQQSSPTC
jgi:nitrogen fixation-related uncharacterized protein